MTQELFSTLIPIALIGLIALVIGVVVGFLLASLSNQSTQDDQNKKKSLTELARLWRDRTSGKVIVEMNSKMFSTPDELRSDQQAALSKALDELQLWLGADDLVARVLTTTESSALPEPSPLVQSESLPAVSDAAKIVSLSAASKAISHPPESEVKPPSMQIGDIIAQVFSPEKTKTASKSIKSIAAQVDEIIQERLPGSAFKNRIISVTDLPGRGLLVRVDNLSYEGIGDVADADIRQFLRECVSEWERRSEIG
jgi:hypothetical protein